MRHWTWVSLLRWSPVATNQLLTHAHTHVGLANRVVKKGTSLNEALKVANQISDFPHLCLIRDRDSAYHSVFHSHSADPTGGVNWLKEALAYEIRNGIDVVTRESISGAKRFAGGIGRKGDFSKL